MANTARPGAGDLARSAYSPPASLSPSRPPPPAPEAFYGPAGDFVRLVEPHTEADPVALQVQFLVFAGTMIGRSPHYLVEGTCHYPNEFAVIVGRTSKSRKGTSLGRVEQVCALVDPDFVKGRVSSGLSSGEGLIAQVRDPSEGTEEVRERGRVVGHHQVVTDEGIADKRFLAAEGEFASVFKTMGRQGNTLSAVLRNAWDGRPLRTLVKNSPHQALEPHISIVGHITLFELLSALGENEMSNGLANRFLWCFASRSKLLPEGGRLPDENLRRFAGLLAERIHAARRVGEVRLHESARAAWATTYARLGVERPGYVGALLARGEAHVIRLAMIYALLDGRAEILPAHLEAAVALWSYCEASVQYVFGRFLGNPLADRLLAMLREAPDGLDREEIRDAFSRRKNTQLIVAALSFLHEEGLARCEQRATGGRPEERWFATRPDATEATEATQAPTNPDSVA